MQALATHCISQAGIQRERHKLDPQDFMDGLERFFSLQIYNYTTQERAAYPLISALLIFLISPEDIWPT